MAVRHQRHLPFGGKIVVLGGDFLRTLPILKFGEISVREESVIGHELWPSFQILRRHDNMRAANDPSFPEWLSHIADGSANDVGDELTILPIIGGRRVHHCLGPQELIHSVFENDYDNYKRCISTPYNESCEK